MKKELTEVIDRLNELQDVPASLRVHDLVGVALDALHRATRLKEPEDQGR